MRRINIAIDGPSGAGKSTLAKALAKALDIHYLDTGAMYRAMAYAALKDGIDIGSPEQVTEFTERIDLRTEYNGNEQIVIVSGENVMPYIRAHEISKAASEISAYPCVRYKLVKMQQDVAQKYDVVLDGRDIGTYVLPNAEYKFFITADIEERAKRRYIELKEKGTNKEYIEVYNDMKIRDENDSNRSLAPLRQAEDAQLIDTTNMNEDDVLDAVMSRIRLER